MPPPPNPEGRASQVTKYEVCSPRDSSPCPVWVLETTKPNFRGAASSGAPRVGVYVMTPMSTWGQSPGLLDPAFHSPWRSTEQPMEEQKSLVV